MEVHKWDWVASPVSSPQAPPLTTWVAAVDGFGDAPGDGIFVSHSQAAQHSRAQPHPSPYMEDMKPVFYSPRKPRQQQQQQQDIRPQPYQQQLHVSISPGQLHSRLMNQAQNIPPPQGDHQHGHPSPRLLQRSHHHHNVASPTSFIHMVRRDGREMEVPSSPPRQVTGGTVPFSPPPQQAMAAGPPPPAPAPIANINPPLAMSHKRHVVCMYKYQPLPEHSLSLIHNGLSPVIPLALNRGDVVFATARHKSGWWFGERWQPGCKTGGGCEMGWFPVAHTSGHRVKFGSTAMIESGASGRRDLWEGLGEDGRDGNKKGDGSRLLAVEEGMEEEEEEEEEEAESHQGGGITRGVEEEEDASRREEQERWEAQESLGSGSGGWQVIMLGNFKSEPAAVVADCEVLDSSAVLHRMSLLASEKTARRHLFKAFSQFCLASFLSRDIREGEGFESVWKQKPRVSTAPHLDCSLSSSFDASKLHPSMCGPDQRQHAENHLESKVTSCDAGKGLRSIVDMEHVVANALSLLEARRTACCFCSHAFLSADDVESHQAVCSLSPDGLISDFRHQHKHAIPRIEPSRLNHPSGILEFHR